VPVSIIGTFAAMYLLGYSLNLLSLMALTIATGFVVDDAIVVLENIERHLEAGMPPRQAALVGAREVGFTVLSITLSLVAVFAPILFMGGLIGAFFREFSMTLTVAIMISLVISLTTTPMLCALLLRRRQPEREGLWSHALQNAFAATQAFYGRTLQVALRHPRLVVASLILVIAANVQLYKHIPKGLFPQQDTGRLIGRLEADQSISFANMSKKLEELIRVVKADPDIDTVVGFTGAGSGGGFGSVNTATVFAALKPLGVRHATADQVIARLRPKLNHVPGGRLYFFPAQDLSRGPRSSSSQFQYTLGADDTAQLHEWAQKLVDQLQKRGRLKDVTSDQQTKALETDLVIDRDAAARYGITPAMIDNTLYDAFGQRQVSVIFAAINQYHVVMEIDPRYTQRPSMLDEIYISTAGGAAKGSATTNLPSGAVTQSGAATASAGSASLDSARNASTNALAASGRSSASAGAAVSTARETMIPLSAIAHYQRGVAPLSVNHQGAFVTTTISYNLALGDSESDAEKEIRAAAAEIQMPASVHPVISGANAMFADSFSNMPLLLLIAILSIYIVLGILYESAIHPITILSTLPSAGLGALVGQMAFGIEFTVISAIAVVLLIGIVKKNAILMVDFAIDARRERNLSPFDAIYQACLMRFRPIMMTTFAAVLGAAPLAIGFGEGGEVRRPLGVSIVGGLLVSQVLTLYTTPVIYLYLDRFSLWMERKRESWRRRGTPAPETI